jgi:hypothetical protein
VFDRASPAEVPEAPAAEFTADIALKVVAEMPREAPVAPAASLDAEPVAPVRECRVWGPAQSAEELAELGDRLAAQGGFPEIRESYVQSEPDYMVYVSKLGSRERAKMTAGELKSLDIDSYLINRDDQGPILSVGVFSQKVRAERQRERLQTLGYDVVLEVLERNQTVFELTAHVLVESPEYATSTSPCPAIAQGR